MQADELLQRVKGALGRPAATMLLEPGTDRHLITEAMLMAAALYVLGKYLDGFVEGLGVQALGKEHGEKIAQTIESTIEATEAALSSGDPPEPDALERHAGAISETILALQKQGPSPEARAAAEARLREVLLASGVPATEARKRASNIARAIWNDDLS